MSGFLGNLHDRHQQHKERREERREERHERHGRHQDEYDNSDNYGSHHDQRHQANDADEYNDDRRPQSYQPQGYQSYPSQGQGQGRGYAPPGGPPPSSRGPSVLTSQGGLDRGDFASDADIDRMVASGEFDERPARQGYGSRPGYGGGAGNAYGRHDAPSGPPPSQAYGERASEYGRYDTPSGPPPGQAHGERASEYGRYDTPSGPPPGRGYQSQQSRPQEYGSGSAYAPGYGGGSDRQGQHGPQQTQGRSQYGAPQGGPPGYGRGQGNTPSGGFSASQGREEQYGGPRNDYGEPPRRGEAAGYYNQQGAPGQGDRYTRLADIAQEHGDDPALYRQATQGLHEKIQAQSQRPRRDQEDDDYKAHVDAHRKAYGGDDHGPMDADAIGAAAAMEAFKQTATAGSSNAPAGAFQAGRASGGSAPKPARAAQAEEEEEEDTSAARAGGSGGLQDKLMALAMSHAGKLFDKKNAGSSGDQSENKAQAMQSAAATAMQLFGKYQTGKLDSSDMSSVMGLAMKMM